MKQQRLIRNVTDVLEHGLEGLAVHVQDVEVHLDVSGLALAVDKICQVEAGILVRRGKPRVPDPRHFRIRVCMVLPLGPQVKDVLDAQAGGQDGGPVGRRRQVAEGAGAVDEGWPEGAGWDKAEISGVEGAWEGDEGRG